MRTLALVAIRLYQRFISPYKGFSCAYRLHTGRCSCSQLGFRAIRRFGVSGGWLVLRQRTHLCGVAHRRFSVAAVHRRPPAKQRGDCDCGAPCDIDLPSSGGKWGWCDVGCDLLDCGGSDREKRQPPKRRKSTRADGKAYLPPKRSQI